MIEELPVGIMICIATLPFITAALICVGIMIYKHQKMLNKQLEKGE